MTTDLTKIFTSYEIHYFYRIDNLINGKFYYGIRTCHCLPGRDEYMGSGCHLHKAFRKYGLENFKKTVLRISPTRIDVSDLERWIVTEELVKDPMCYNERVGGDVDSFYGKVSCIDTLTGANVMISKDLYYSDRDRYKSHRATAGKITAIINATGKTKLITTDEFHQNKNKYTSILSVISKGTSIYYNIETGKNERMRTDDPKIGVTAFNISLGRKHSDEARHKISESNRKMTGEDNSMYGRHLVWINNGKSRKRVESEEVQLYLNTGEWIKGTNLDRIHKSKTSENSIHKKNGRHGHTGGFIHITNGVDNKTIHPDRFPEYELQGYRRGMTKRPPSVYNPNSGYQKGNKWMTDLDGKRRSVRSGDIDKRLDEGWTFIE